MVMRSPIDQIKAFDKNVDFDPYNDEGIDGKKIRKSRTKKSGTPLSAVTIPARKVPF